MYANKLKPINNSITTMIFQLYLNGDYYTGFKCCNISWFFGARCSSVVRAFAHGAMDRRIDPSWGEPTELFPFPDSASRLV